MATACRRPDLRAAPAEPFADLKRRAAAAILAARAEILELSHRIHANPEPAFEERQAATWVAEAIARHGYAVEHPAGRLETAVRGRLAGGRGGAGPRIGILAEYDALPGPRPRLRPQHDGRVGRRRRDRAGGGRARTCRARSSSSARPPRSAAPASR